MSSGAEFRKRLAFGLQGESVIEAWLVTSGYNVIPVTDGVRNGRGPRILKPNGVVTAPDFLTLNESAQWQEVKTKSHFTYYRARGKFQTGIDGAPWAEYVKANLENKTNLLFLHLLDDPQSADPQCPMPECPTGLYGQSVDYLQEHIDHSSDKFGNGGMVFWNVDALHKLATLEELAEAVRKYKSGEYVTEEVELKASGIIFPEQLALEETQPEIELVMVAPEALPPVNEQETPFEIAYAQLPTLSRQEAERIIGALVLLMLAPQNAA